MSKDKLRVFNKNNNNMYYLEEEDYIILDYNKRNGWTLKTLWTDNEPKIIAYSDEIIIMDYIRLKDKNMKEIYEEDIIRVDVTSNAGLDKNYLEGVVEFHKGQYSLKVYERSYYPLSSYYWDMGNENLEKIGNTLEG